MKKLLTVILCATMLTLTGCAEPEVIAIGVENKETLSNNRLGKSALARICDMVYYDSTTGIVYWWNGNYGGNGGTTPSPYYAPNGLPYRYNPETNTFEEIGE